MSVARTAAGVEGSLLIHPDGTLVTSASMMFGEMRQFLFPPENEQWVPLNGDEVDARKHPRLAEKTKRLPKIDHMWVYVG